MVVLQSAKRAIKISFFYMICYILKCLTANYSARGQHWPVSKLVSVTLWHRPQDCCCCLCLVSLPIVLLIWTCLGHFVAPCSCLCWGRGINMMWVDVATDIWDQLTQICP